MIQPPNFDIHIADLRQRLADYAALDLEFLSQKEVTELVGQLIHAFPFKAQPLELNAVFRARPNADSSTFKNASELWYHPHNSKPSAGRLNRAGTRIFYAANTLNTALLEVGTGPHSVATALIARTRQQPTTTINLAFIGATASMSFDIGDGFHEVRAAQVKQALGPIGYRKYHMVDQWLTSAIVQPVAPDESWRYKTTIALAELLFNSPFDGINYPSVKTKGHGLNVAFTTVKADEIFQPDEAWMFGFGDYLMDSTWSEPAMNIYPIRRSASIADTGEIDWLPVGVGLNDFTDLMRGQINTLDHFPDGKAPKG